MWRIAFSRCTNQAVIAGGGVSIPTYQTCFLDTNLISLSPVQYIPSSNCCHDVGLLALDNYGNCYQETNLSSYFADGLYENQLVKLPLPTLLPVTYHVNTNYAFTEASSIMYYDGTGGSTANGYNGLTTSKTIVYSYDGYVLKKWDGPTGNLLSYKRINYPAGGDSTKIYWGGISADDCGNLFLGDNSTVRQYDSTLTLTNSYTMTGVITDVNWSNTGVLYVCGIGFATSLTPTGIITCNSGGPLSLSTTASNSTCNSTTGSATVTISGGSPPYNIVWNTTPPQYGTSINNVPAGTYTVTVTESSCLQQVKTDTVIITAGPGSFTTTADITSGCTGSITITTQGGTAPFNYAWSNGLPNSNTVTGLATGTYSVTITDAGGCTYSQTIPIFISSLPIATASALPSVLINQGDYSQLSATGGGTYSWLPISDLSCTACPNPIATPAANTDYCVTVISTDGCSDSACVSITVEFLDTCGTVFIPSAFTPNNNDLNEVFKPVLSCVHEYNFIIFNRWGEKIFESSAIVEGWNGRSKGKMCEQDVYIYKIIFVDDTSNEFHQYIGQVTLLR